MDEHERIEEIDRPLEEGPTAPGARAEVGVEELARKERAGEGDGDLRGHGSRRSEKGNREDHRAQRNQNESSRPRRKVAHRPGEERDQERNEPEKRGQDIRLHRGEALEA